MACAFFELSFFFFFLVAFNFYCVVFQFNFTPCTVVSVELLGFRKISVGPSDICELCCHY